MYRTDACFRNRLGLRARYAPMHTPEHISFTATILMINKDCIELAKTCPNTTHMYARAYTLFSNDYSLPTATSVSTQM